MRVLRALVLAAAGLIASGIPQVVGAALGDDCCTESCPDAPDGKRCPPNCSVGVCAKAPASLAAAGATLDDPASRVAPFVAIAQTSPRLPMVTIGVFHPPRA